METWVWWERLQPLTRGWLSAHNGEPVPADLIEEVVAATGGRPDDVFAPEHVGPRRLSDDVSDWIEAVPNGEGRRA